MFCFNFYLIYIKINDFIKICKNKNILYIILIKKRHKKVVCKVFTRYKISEQERVRCDYRM